MKRRGIGWVGMAVLLAGCAGREARDSGSVPEAIFVARATGVDVVNALLALSERNLASQVLLTVRESDGGTSGYVLVPISSAADLKAGLYPAPAVLVGGTLEIDGLFVTFSNSGEITLWRLRAGSPAHEALTATARSLMKSLELESAAWTFDPIVALDLESPPAPVTGGTN